MGDSVREVATNLGLLVVVIGFFGTAFIYLKGSAYKGTIDALTENVQALKDKAEIQQGEIEDLKRKRAEDAKQIEKLSTENQTLLAQRPSNVILEGIVNMISANHVELMAMIKER